MRCVRFVRTLCSASYSALCATPSPLGCVQPPTPGPFSRPYQKGHETRIWGGPYIRRRRTYSKGMIFFYRRTKYIDVILSALCVTPNPGVWPALSPQLPPYFPEQVKKGSEPGYWRANLDLTPPGWGSGKDWGAATRPNNDGGKWKFVNFEELFMW